jgi:hypothetical protein
MGYVHLDAGGGQMTKLHCSWVQQARSSRKALIIPGPLLLALVFGCGTDEFNLPIPISLTPIAADGTLVPVSDVVLPAGRFAEFCFCSELGLKASPTKEQFKSRYPDLIVDAIDRDGNVIEFTGWSGVYAMLQRTYPSKPEICVDRPGQLTSDRDIVLEAIRVRSTAKPGRRFGCLWLARSRRK